MKRSDLRQIIREEISRVTEEFRYLPGTKVKKGAKEILVIFDAPSDRRGIKKISFKLQPDGDYRVWTHGDHYRNFHIKTDIDEIRFLADEGKWLKVFSLLAKGIYDLKDIKVR